MPNCHLVTAYAELRMLSEHEGEGEAVNCGAYVVSARYTYLRLIAILKLMVWLCVESGRGSGRTERLRKLSLGRCAISGDV
jgi:hypothetical protein